MIGDTRGREVSKMTGGEPSEVSKHCVDDLCDLTGYREVSKMTGVYGEPSEVPGIEALCG